MDISSTPLYHTSAFLDEDRDHNHLSDFEMFLGHTERTGERSSVNRGADRTGHSSSTGVYLPGNNVPVHWHRFERRPFGTLSAALCYSGYGSKKSEGVANVRPER